MRLALIAVFVLCLFSLPAAAGTPPQPVFFEALYDVPVMPGLEEAADEAVLFDKPDGRIASVVAASRVLGADDVARYYHDCLPELGWVKTSNNQYIRGNQHLNMEILEKPPLTVVRFNLSPAPAHRARH